MKEKTLPNPNQIIQYVVSSDNLKEIFLDMLGQARACVLNAKEEDDNNRLVNIETACKIVQKDRSTLWRWEKSGYLRPTMRGRKKLYHYSDLVKIKGGSYDI